MASHLEQVTHRKHPALFRTQGEKAADGPLHVAHGYGLQPAHQVARQRTAKRYMTSIGDILAESPSCFSLMLARQLFAIEKRHFVFAAERVSDTPRRAW